MNLCAFNFPQSQEFELSNPAEAAEAFLKSGGLLYIVDPDDDDDDDAFQPKTN